MKKQRITFIACLLVVFGMLAAACGDDDSTSAGDDAAGDDSADDGTGDGAGDDGTGDDGTGDDGTGDDMGEGELPGEGVSITMGKADWNTEDPNAYVARAILQELGYDVSDPRDLELGPSQAYISMAQADMDFWINSWYPGHRSWLANELPDGSLVGDHLSIVGEMMPAGGLQGYLVTKSFADEFGITSLDDLNNNPDALAAYDAQDPVPGNGVADIYGCQESYTCDDIITSQIAFSGWDNIGQTIAGYDAMFAEAATKADAGEPMVIYTWTPSAYITQLRPGDNVVWLTVEDVIDDSNPTGVEGGEEHSQLPGTATIGTDECPGSADGTCTLGWVAADILVTANSDFLEANPAVEQFLTDFKMSVLEVSLMNVDMSNGADVQQLAADWITDNRDTVDTWIANAIAAA
ncbi:MAG: glycine betaine ABC transporter substrate-binding protein [Acidimicrobiales bacterium]|nr:glycine betaine ABC transporter substrate-binding protein [Acidimicrobiales bacterium]